MLKHIMPVIESHGVGFAVVRTMLEGFEQNTFEQRQETQEHYQLALPFGHNAVGGSRPTVKEDYG